MVLAPAFNLAGQLPEVTLHLLLAVTSLENKPCCDECEDESIRHGSLSPRDADRERWGRVVSHANCPAAFIALETISRSGS